MHRLLILGVVSVALLTTSARHVTLSAQNFPLAPNREAGQTATPVFEGWYKNRDGTFSLAFGYYNRNTREALDIPIGAANFMSPSDSNQGQPTRLEPGRHWGVFGVTVPANFGETAQVTWTLSVRGETFAIPGSLKRGWEIDAIEGGGASGNTPPVVKFEPNGVEARGPAGAFGKPLTGKVGAPLSLSAWASDPPGPNTAAARAAGTGSTGAGSTGAGAATATGRASAAGRAGTTGGTVTLAWFKHQGPGAVTFTPAAPRADRAADGLATSTATFSEPGEYILRLRVNDASGVAGAGHAQCCWTNGFLKVTISR